MRKNIFPIVIIVLLFASFSVSMAGDAKNKPIVIDHLKKAEYYDNKIQRLKTKILEEKEILAEYDSHSYYYGPEGQLYESHHKAQLREYEKAIERNQEMADTHRKLAKEKNN